MEARSYPEDAKQKSFDIIKGLIRNVATARLKSYINVDTIETREILADEDFSYNHWIAVIVISATTIRINFRVHFTTKDAREFIAHNPYLKDVNDPSISQDFVREYCNLTAGAIKDGLERAFAASDHGYKINLPASSSSFDAFSILPSTSNLDTMQDTWAFRFGGHEIFCAATAEIIDWNRIGTISKIDLSSLLVSDNGDIVFL